MAKQIKMWQANDGKMFHDEVACLNHEAWTRIVNGFKPIYGSSEGCKIGFNEFCDWADDNWDWLKSFMVANGVNNG